MEMTMPPTTTPKHHDHDGFHGSQQVLHRRVHFILVEVRDFLQHGVHRASLFAHADHLRHHARKYSGVLQWIHQRAPRFHRFASLH